MKIARQLHEFINFLDIGAMALDKSLKEKKENACAP
jgi:hypothetical protein